MKLFFIISQTDNDIQYEDRTVVVGKNINDDCTDCSTAHGYIERHRKRTKGIIINFRANARNIRNHITLIIGEYVEKSTYVGECTVVAAVHVSL